MNKLYKDDKKYILNIYNRIDINIDRAEGVYLYDVNNNRYLDMYSGISVNNLGYDKGVAEAIKKQVDKYIHLSNYFPSRPVVNLAKILIDNTPASKVFFSNSGTEANEAAIKLCRKYGKIFSKEKCEILSSLNSFHGRTFGSLSITGQEKYQKYFQPVVPKMEYFIFNDIESLKSKVNDNTCAVFLEIIQGEGGIIEADKEFIQEVVKLSDKYNYLIVIDEVQTGLGRTGELFAYNNYKIKPDIVTLGKSIGGGLPLGATLINEKIEGILKPGDHGSTFGGNPVACAAGYYVLRKLVNTDILQNVRSNSQYMINRLRDMKDSYPNIINDIRGRGFMIGIDCGEYAFAIREEAFNEKVLLNITNNTVIRLLPALCISKEEIDEFLNVFNLVLNNIQKEIAD